MPYLKFRRYQFHLWYRPNDNSKGGIGSKDFSSMFDFYVVDENFINVMGLDVIDGTDFYKDDRRKEGDFLVNESMAALTEGNIVGRTFDLGRPNKNKVIGIVRDFPVESVKEKIKPTAYFLRKSNGDSDGMLNKVAIRVETADLKATISEIETVWRTIYPDQVFDLKFMDDRIKRTYSDELKMGSVFSVFTIIAVVISCLGLLGLITYIVQVRLKEVSIRKVLGANFMSLAKLLTHKIWVIMLLASVIAFPLAYYFLGFWLDTFAYRAEITSEIFIGTLFLFMVIVLVTIFWQVRRVVMVNPSDILRNE